MKQPRQRGKCPLAPLPVADRLCALSFAPAAAMAVTRMRAVLTVATAAMPKAGGVHWRRAMMPTCMPERAVMVAM